MKSLMFRSVLSSIVCGVLAFSTFGCRSDDDLADGDVDMLDPIDMNDTGYTDGPRDTAFGMLITDADAEFENVAFPYDSFQIADSERGKIEQVANYMNNNNGVTVVVDGHCDERGSREYNLSLGEHRALAVRAYLITLGVSGGLVQTRSFGEEQPVDPGHGASSWSNNRRGEFALYR